MPLPRLSRYIALARTSVSEDGRMMEMGSATPSQEEGKPAFHRLAGNFLANSGYQLLSLGLNLLALPIYLSLLGPERYALIGFGLTVLVWTTLIDAGMSPTLSRDMARYRSGELRADVVRSLLQSLDWICLALILGLGALGWLSRDWWAQSWFQEGALGREVIATSMVLIIVFCLLRWASGVYRSALMGLERQVFANLVSSVGVAARLIGPIPILYSYPDVRLLFAIWAAVSLVELVVFRIAAGAPFGSRRPFGRFSGTVIAERARLAGGIMLLSLVYVLTTQTDKLLLSRLLPLVEYGWLSLAVVLANGVLMLTLPITQAFQPSFTVAAAARDNDELRRLIVGMNSLMVLTVLVPALVLAAFPQKILFAWTGDAVAAAAVSPYLGYYVVGTALIGPAAVAFVVQLAYGSIRMHLAANLLAGALLVPALWIVAGAYGASGAAMLWCAMNLAMLLLYCPLVLVRFVPGAARPWLANLIRPAAAAAAVALAGRLLLGDRPADRIVDLLPVIPVGIAALAAGAAVDPAARRLAARIWAAAGARLGRGSPA